MAACLRTRLVRQPRFNLFTLAHSASKSVIEARTFSLSRPLSVTSAVRHPNALLTAPLRIRPFFSFTSNPSPARKTLQPLFFINSRQLSTLTNTSPLPPPHVQSLPPLSPPSVSSWLLFSSLLVFGIIVVGGVTRLTESGLSITEWRPITGTIPPLSQDEWEDEFDKYKATPEFKLLNHRITLTEFKRIFYMEYAHRLLGRVVGLTFALPFLYFIARKRLSPQLPATLGALTALLGFQGFLGWYMVQSGLEDSLMDTPGAVPRVSQYRLAAHLGAALVLYAGMLSTGLQVRREWKWANGGSWSGLKEWKWAEVLTDRRVLRFRAGAASLLGLVFLTAISGAFVAGLDAGLVYNEFPTMGGRLMPPIKELFSVLYAKNPNKSDAWWRNLLENPTTVQFDHRVLATTTYVSTFALYLSSLSPSLRSLLPPLSKHLIKSAFLVANLQVLLGISTLIYLVPVPLAAAHQAGSVALLTAVVALVGSLRKPGLAAKIWRKRKAMLA